MARAAVACSVLSFSLLVAPPSIQADEQVPSGAQSQLASLPNVYLQVASSTWRSRGRVSFALAPSLKMKLESAGFAVVENRTDPHELTLKVEYREERGRQFRIDLYGTDITCAITLEHEQQGQLVQVTIRESPTYADRDTGPYIEVLHRFETNPYYYFLGDIVKGRVVSRLDVNGSLVRGLERLVETESRLTSADAEAASNPGNTLPASDVLLARQALDNAILEVGRLRDARAIPVLTKLLAHQDRQIRLSSVAAHGAIRSAASRPTLARVAQYDRDKEVRAAAAAVLADSAGSVPPP